MEISQNVAVVLVHAVNYIPPGLPKRNLINSWVIRQAARLFGGGF